MPGQTPLSTSRYIYGTTRLGDEAVPFQERVAVARQALGSSIWLHTSHQYGEALQVLRAALDEDRSNVPPFIYKVGWESVDQVREQVKLQISTLGVDKMDVAQLCLGGGLAASLQAGTKVVEGLLDLKQEGLVGKFVIEVFPWTSAAPAASLKAGKLGHLVDAVIFYLNPLQRFVSNELWDELLVSGFPIVAMRTVCGGSIESLLTRDNYLAERAASIRPIYERSGCSTWPEFCVRYSLGFPQVLGTVGATSHTGRLREFIALASHAKPLHAETQGEVMMLQRKWWDDVDRHAEPWSM